MKSFLTVRSSMPKTFARFFRETASESVRKVHQLRQSFLSMRRIEARRRKASAFRVRFSKSLAKRRQRLSHAKVRSTTQRRGRSSKPFGLIGAFDDVDLKVRQDFGRSLLKDRALISAVSKELL